MINRELIKIISANLDDANRYFWRTQAQQEIDYIDEYEGILHAYEFKWNKDSKASLPISFANAYPDHEFKTITRDNYEEFIY